MRLKSLISEAEEPVVKLGTIVQAYGFPMLTGFKGENFYKVVKIDGENAYFQRCNELGDIGNIGVDIFPASIKNVQQAVKSVETGISSNGLKIWKERKMNYSIDEARGVKTIQKEYDKVIDEIETTLESYKKAKGTPKAQSIVTKLKDLNEKKKKLTKELDDKVSGLYKDAELKITEKYLYPKGVSQKPGFFSMTKDIDKLLTYAKDWNKFYNEFRKKYPNYGTDGKSVGELKHLFNTYRKMEREVSENIPGGKAEGLGLKAIAKMHGVDPNDLLQQFKAGIKVEMEHTTDVQTAKEIVLDHLYETPFYYTKLKSAKL